MMRSADPSRAASRQQENEVRQSAGADRDDAFPPHAIQRRCRLCRRARRNLHHAPCDADDTIGRSESTTRGAGARRKSRHRAARPRCASLIVRRTPAEPEATRRIARAVCLDRLRAVEAAGRIRSGAASRQCDEARRADPATVRCSGQIVLSAAAGGRAAKRRAPWQGAATSPPHDAYRDRGCRGATTIAIATGAGGRRPPRAPAWRCSTRLQPAQLTRHAPITCHRSFGSLEAVWIKSSRPVA